jgi:hypothetical protein
MPGPISTGQPGSTTPSDERSDDVFDELTALRNIYDAIQQADDMVKAYLAGINDEEKAGKVAGAALLWPMKGFQGIVEGMAEAINPDEFGG